MNLTQSVVSTQTSSTNAEACFTREYSNLHFNKEVNLHVIERVAVSGFGSVASCG